VRIIIDLDESITVGAHIEGVGKPSPQQALALRDLAITAGELREVLLGHIYPNWNLSAPGDFTILGKP